MSRRLAGATRRAKAQQARDRAARDAAANPPAAGESQRSANYRAGRAIRYSGRINAGVAEVTSFPIDELPADSKLHDDDPNRHVAEHPRRGRS